MMVSFSLTRVSLLFIDSCDPVFSWSDGMNESFILTRLLGLIFSITFLLCFMLPFPLPVLDSSSSLLSSSALPTLAAQVPGGFRLSPGEVLLGLAVVSVGLDGL